MVFKPPPPKKKETKQNNKNNMVWPIEIWNNLSQEK